MPEYVRYVRLTEKGKEIFDWLKKALLEPTESDKLRKAVEP